MGFFTWTLANRKEKRTRYGEYARECKLPYNGYGAVVCPDDTIIKEYNYDGYGHFDDKDIYELVVDWNKDKLLDIMQIPEIKNSSFYDAKLKAITVAYANDDDAALHDILVTCPDYMQKEWKREIGIAIAAGKTNVLLPCPIKIVNTTRQHAKYKTLPPSVGTQ
jgi:hypothetical protein